MSKNSPFRVTAELFDSVTDSDADWPHDPAVPEHPPMPATDDAGLDPDSFLTSHYTEFTHPPKVANPPPPLNDLVIEGNPLKIEVAWSMRSPYSYLAMHRLLWLYSNYNVDLTIRFVLPVAVRSTKGGKGKAGGLFSISYKLPAALDALVVKYYSS